MEIYTHQNLKFQKHVSGETKHPKKQMREFSKGLKPKENFHFSNEENIRMTRTNKQ